MFAVVSMADQRNDRADLSTFGGRWTGEYGKIGVAGEITGAADAVHHLASHDVGAVHVAKEIDLDGGVDRDEPEAADNFRMITDLLAASECVAGRTSDRC